MWTLRHAPARTTPDFAARYPTHARAGNLCAYVARHTKPIFGNGLGFLLISVGWPIAHVSILLTIYTVAGRVAPVGDSTILFFASGLIPYITFNYIARWTMLGVVHDRALLSLPIVKIFYSFLARLSIELLGAWLATVCLVIIVWAVGTDPMPHYFVEAAHAYGAAILLGVGVGLLNGIICLIFPVWVAGYTGLAIPLYISSGILFDPDTLPEKARYFLTFNPVLHVVEWMRSAYYPGYGSVLLDKTYPISIGICAIFFALLLERLVRGRVLGR